ncbi:MAG: hypothetical protein NT128_06665 [Proteobacteria bacterium]|nr:hypothetical protein [Pseudomonadota bacterium]
MRFIFLTFIVGVICSSFSANAASSPKTSITLKNPQGTCKVQVAAWLSPSCAHCAGYFSDEIPKITGLPGFCLDLHFFPHLYPLDMPIAVLIWSQGPENAYRIAELFYKGQNEWLSSSSSRDKVDDSRRVDDLNEYLNSIKNNPSFQKIKDYLDPRDPYLYVKIFALRHFSVEHLEKYLPKGKAIDTNLSLALLKDLPIKDGEVVKFSPAFTIAGNLIPDSQLERGILTKDIAGKMLQTAATLPNNNVAQPLPPAAVKKSQPKKIEIKPEDKDIQDADGDVHMQDTDDSEMQDADADENDDNDPEEEFPENEDWEEEENDSDDQLDEIIDEATS